MGKVNSYISNNCFLVEPKIKKIRSCKFVTNLNKKQQRRSCKCAANKIYEKMGICKCATNELTLTNNKYNKYINKVQSCKCTANKIYEKNGELQVCNK